MLTLRAHSNGEQINSYRSVPKLGMLGPVTQQSSLNATKLVRSERLLGGTEADPTTGFDFHGHQVATSHGDNIDFALT